MQQNQQKRVTHQRNPHPDTHHISYGQPHFRLYRHQKENPPYKGGGQGGGRGVRYFTQILCHVGTKNQILGCI